MTDATVSRGSAANSIGFLRLLLAALVVYTHAWLLGGFGPEPLAEWTGDSLTAGKLAVECFFVLSGFLVATSYRRLRSPVSFLWHRALRLVPGGWACLLVTAFVLAPLVFLTSSAGDGFFAQEPSALGYVVRNLFAPRHQIGIGTLLAGNPWPTDFNGSLWTLSYEAACYGAVVLVGVAGLLDRFRFAALAMGALALLGLGLQIAGHALPAVSWLYNTPGKLLCLHFGAGVLWSSFPRAAEVVSARHWPGAIALVLTAAAWHFGCGEFISPLLLPVALWWAVHRLPLRNWEKKARGDYSYGIYVYGYPVEQMLVHFGLHRAGLPAFLGLSLALTLALAFLSWRFIEAPALRLKHLLDKFRRPALASAQAGTVA